VTNVQVLDIPKWLEGMPQSIQPGFFSMYNEVIAFIAPDVEP
jgi:hypothetical protein